MWPTFYALVGLAFGVILVFSHPSTKRKSLKAKIALGLLAGIGIGVVFNAGREAIEIAWGRSASVKSVAEAEQYVKQQIEQQAKQSVGSIRLRDDPSGGFVGEAQVGQVVYDVKVSMNGQWEARRR